MTPDETRKIAEKTHANQIEFAKGANLAAVSTGTETVKAILLINGGACVAVLAFLILLDRSLLFSQSVQRLLRTTFNQRHVVVNPKTSFLFREQLTIARINEWAGLSPIRPPQNPPVSPLTGGFARFRRFIRNSMTCAEISISA